AAVQNDLAIADAAVRNQGAVIVNDLAVVGTAPIDPDQRIGRIDEPSPSQPADGQAPGRKRELQVFYITPAAVELVPTDAKLDGVEDHRAALLRDAVGIPVGELEVGHPLSGSCAGEHDRPLRHRPRRHRVARHFDLPPEVPTGANTHTGETSVATAANGQDQ